MTSSHNTVVRRLLDLAADEDNQAFIVQEVSCLAGLTNYLTHNDVDIVLMAVEAISLLSSNKDNRKVLCQHPGLMKNVNALVSSEHDGIKHFAKDASRSLSKYADKEIENSNSQNTPASEQYVSKKSYKKSRKTNTYKIKVRDLADENICSRIETALIRIRGVISLTLDQNRSRIIVCSKMEKDQIMPSITAAVEEAGSEVVAKRSKNKASGYIDDDEDREDVFGGGVLSRFGSQTLQSRLAAQRKKEEEEERRNSKAMASVASAAGSAARWGMSWLGY